MACQVPHFHEDCPGTIALLEQPLEGLPWVLPRRHFKCHLMIGFPYQVDARGYIGDVELASNERGRRQRGSLIDGQRPLGRCAVQKDAVELLHLVSRHVLDEQSDRSSAIATCR